MPPNVIAILTILLTPFIIRNSLFSHDFFLIRPCVVYSDLTAVELATQLALKELQLLVHINEKFIKNLVVETIIFFDLMRHEASAFVLHHIVFDILEEFPELDTVKGVDGFIVVLWD